MHGAENIRLGRSRVFFDIEISHQKKGRVVFELVRPETTSDAYDFTRILLPCQSYGVGITIFTDE